MAMFAENQEISDRINFLIQRFSDLAYMVLDGKLTYDITSDKDEGRQNVANIWIPFPYDSHQLHDMMDNDVKNIRPKKVWFVRERVDVYLKHVPIVFLERLKSSTQYIKMYEDFVERNKLNKFQSGYLATLCYLYCSIYNLHDDIEERGIYFTTQSRSNIHIGVSDMLLERIAIQYPGVVYSHEPAVVNEIFENLFSDALQAQFIEPLYTLSNILSDQETPLCVMEYISDVWDQ